MRSWISSQKHSDTWMGEFVTKVINFDFGYEFKVPVDCTTRPGYLDVVKRPIDLGTISANLFNDTYCTRSVDGIFLNNPTVTQMDMRILEVLKDIELVWYNYFLYNVEASTVHCLSIVQQELALVIRK